MNLILFGPPGAGKGTQAQFIVKKYNYFQLSTGDLLRSEIKKETSLGKKIKDIISKGDFASDDLVNSLLEKSITNLKFRDRIIFDGYPRNLVQAKNLENLLKNFNQTIGAIIFLNTSREIIQKNNFYSQWVEHFERHKKKDDLADSFLQGIWYIKEKKFLI